MAGIDGLSLFSTFLMHTGSRHLSFDLTKAQKKIISHPVTKMLILFGMFYVSTRNIYASVALVFGYILLINILLNENHNYNLFPKNWLITNGFIRENEKTETFTVQNYFDNIKKIHNEKE